MTEHDFERTARAWLHDGPSTMPDRALDAALAEIHVTDQRRPLWPARRSTHMFNLARFATAAAGLAVAAVVGVSLLPGSGIGSPRATPTPTPSPSAAPTPMVLAGSLTRSLEAGTYVTGPEFRVQVTFTMPSGWQGSVPGPNLVDLTHSFRNSAMSFELFDRVFADPCNYPAGFLDPAVGPTADDLATALFNMPNIDATSPVDITVDGYRGKHLTLTAPDSFSDCTLEPGATEYVIWELPLGATMPMAPSQVLHVRIVDVEGERLVIAVPERTGYTDEQRAEAQSILDSIRLAPSN